MLRAFSTRNGRHGTSYEKLHGDPDISLLLESKFERSRSYQPSSYSSSSRVSGKKVERVELGGVPAKASSGKKVEVKGHPLFSLFSSRRKKKITARPEFARYLEYVKEGGAGTWRVPPSNGPISYI